MEKFYLEETYDPEMTTHESDERSASWDAFLHMLEEIVVESDELKITIESDYLECPECGELLPKVRIQKEARGTSDHTLTISGKCPDCEESFRYYAYIA